MATRRNPHFSDLNFSFRNIPWREIIINTFGGVEFGNLRAFCSVLFNLKQNEFLKI